MRILNRLTAAITVVLCMASAAQAEKLRFVTSQVNPEEPLTVAMKTFAERVAERTDGQLEIQVLTGDQLGAQKKVNEMILSGAAIMSATDYGQLSTFVPDVGVIAGPYIFREVEQADKFFDGETFKSMEAQLEAKGLKIIMPDGLFGVRHVIGSKPYRSPADMAGVTIRVPTSPVMTATFSAFGARPTELPLGEVYNALQTNVVDAAEGPFGSLAGAKFNEVRKVISETGHQMMFTAWIINKKVFDGLEPDVQNVLLEEGEKISAELTAMTIEYDAEFKEKLKEGGVEVIEDVDVKAFQDQAKNAFDSVPGLTPGIVDKVRAELAE